MRWIVLFSLLLAVPASASPQTADEVLQEGYRQDRPRHILWYGGWIGIQTALTAGSLGLALERGPLFAGPAGSEDWNYQGQMVVGAATSALGLVSIAISVPSTLRPLPEGSDELRRRMASASKQERQARNWFAHLSTTVVNGAAAVVIATVFHSPHDAIVTFLVGMAVGEAQIWTRPMAANRAWRNANGRFPAEFALAPCGTGLALVGRW
jgi:hypothetical protein